MDSQAVCPAASPGCHKNEWLLFPPAPSHPFPALPALGLKAYLGVVCLEAQQGDQLATAPQWDPASGGSHSQLWGIGNVAQATCETLGTSSA